MCWSKYEELQLRKEWERRDEEELRRLEAEAEKRAERMFAEQKEKAREPVGS